jgi:hypothetical protein
MENCTNQECLCFDIIGGWGMRKHFVKLAEEEIYLRQLNAQEKLLKKWSNDEMGRAIHEING